MIKRFTTIAASMAVAGLMGLPANAGDTPSDTQEWAKEAGTAISDVMSFPKIAERQGITGSATFVVTVNRDGDVVDYYPTGRTGAIHFKSSARRSLKNAHFPDLPESFSADQLSFTLNMSYQYQEDLAHKSYRQGKERKGAVTGTRIALLPTVSLSSGR